MVETREKFLLVTEPSSQNTEQDRRKNLIWFLYKDPQQSLSKQKMVWRDLQACQFEGANMDRFIVFMPVSFPTKSVSDDNNMTKTRKGNKKAYKK